jgi:hypothetical protein
MRAAKEKDGDAFVFAAILNDGNFYRRELRAELEDMVSGDTYHLYRRRCESLATYSNRKFDPAPLSDAMAQVDHPAQAPAPADAAQVKLLADSVALLQAKVSRLNSSASWGLAILGVLVIWFGR